MPRTIWLKSSGAILPLLMAGAADIQDNMSRLDRLRPDEGAFLAKRYERALEILQGEEAAR